MQMAHSIINLFLFLKLNICQNGVAPRKVKILLDYMDISLCLCLGRTQYSTVANCRSLGVYWSLVTSSEIVEEHKVPPCLGSGLYKEMHSSGLLRPVGTSAAPPSFLSLSNTLPRFRKCKCKASTFLHNLV